MNDNNRLEQLRAKLVQDGQAVFTSSGATGVDTGNPESRALINDLKFNPHAFVLACLADRQVRFEVAWYLPTGMSKRLGYFDMEKLSQLSLEELQAVIAEPTTLHRFPRRIGQTIYKGIQHINSMYESDASRIWADCPSSASVVRRFLEFDGAGPKIATMAANILARDYRVPMSDHYSIDISVDVHIRRVLTRMGFVPKGATSEYITFRAREMNPEFPGIFDLILWYVGKDICRPSAPRCPECEYTDLCEYAKAGGSNG